MYKILHTYKYYVHTKFGFPFEGDTSTDFNRHYNYPTKVKTNLNQLIAKKERKKKVPKTLT